MPQNMTRAGAYLLNILLNITYGQYFCLQENARAAAKSGIVLVFIKR